MPSTDVLTVKIRHRVLTRIWVWYALKRMALALHWDWLFSEAFERECTCHLLKYPGQGWERLRITRRPTGPPCKLCDGIGWHREWPIGGGPPEQVQCGSCGGTGVVTLTGKTEANWSGE